MANFYMSLFLNVTLNSLRGTNVLNVLLIRFIQYYSIVCLDFFPWFGAFLTPLIDLSFPTLGNLIEKF